MYTTAYQHQIHYVDDGRRSFPGLWLTLSSLDSTLGVEALAALDSGAEISLFDGTLATMIGIDLMAGERQALASATGFRVDSYVHPVSLQVSDIGSVILPVAFSTGPLLRNLLGRDFFWSLKIGFEERTQVINLAAEQP